MKLAVLGAGRMGSTILKMMQRAKIPMTAGVCEPDEKVRGALAKELKGVKLVGTAEELGEPEVVLLAVKPEEVGGSLGHHGEFRIIGADQGS